MFVLKTHLYILVLLNAAIIVGCKSKAVAEEEATPPEEVQTPVTVTTVSNGSLANYVELNATSTYLQSNFIKSSVNGYVQSVSVKPGQFVSAGQLVFTMQTKESKALGNTINGLDSTFRFSGIVRLKAPTSGFIADLSHQAGDYVPDGEQLAVLTNSKSFGFLLNLPYELNKVLSSNKTVVIEMPDGIKLKGVVSSVMPNVDSVSQTQMVMIKVQSRLSIPQNVIAKVRFITGSKTSAVSVPKETVLTDEAQTNFWVMKMIDSITAVKTPVIKGMETKDRVELISPHFNLADKILLTGNYGLGDTAKVKILKE